MYLSVYVFGYVCEWCVTGWGVLKRDFGEHIWVGSVLFGVHLGAPGWCGGNENMDVCGQWSVWEGAPGWHV